MNYYQFAKNRTNYFTSSGRAFSVGLTRFLWTAFLRCFSSVFIGPTLPGTMKINKFNILLKFKRETERRRKPRKGTTADYIVQQPGALLKTWETTCPMSFQRIKLWASSRLLLGPPSCPKSLRRQLTKSEGVTPSLLYALTEVTNVFVMSNRASASATCSLGFCTEENHIKAKV